MVEENMSGKMTLTWLHQHPLNVYIVIFAHVICPTFGGDPTFAPATIAQDCDDIADNKELE